MSNERFIPNEKVRSHTRNESKDLLLMKLLLVIFWVSLEDSSLYFLWFWGLFLVIYEWTFLSLRISYQRSVFQGSFGLLQIHIFLFLWFFIFSFLFFLSFRNMNLLQPYEGPFFPLGELYAREPLFHLSFVYNWFPGPYIKWL